MDHWDPLLVNAIAETRPVILFDNAGIGQSSGPVADTMKSMAANVIQFLDLIGLKQVDILGFSIGGFIAPLVYLNGPTGLVRKLIIAGSSTSAGEDVISHSEKQEEEVSKLAGAPQIPYEGCIGRLFFLPSESSQKAGRAFWERAHERGPASSGEERSKFVSEDYADGGAGLKAMVAARNSFRELENRADGSYDRLADIKIPVFIAQGSDDFMLPTYNSYLMQQKMPNARLKIFPDSGHAFLYQYAEEFARDVSQFLDGEN
jgi:pimeloyl-ACP methyl ester carboxylesterase